MRFLEDGVYYYQDRKGSMKEKHSVLRAILNQVYQAKTLEEAFAITEKLLLGSPLRENEKQAIIRNAEECTSLVRLQQYITNSWLKYEGMSSHRFDRKEF